MLVVAIVSLAALASTVVFGVASLVGERVRSGALIADRGAAPAEAVRYTEAPRSAAFFAERDSVRVRVPWDMTLAVFLSLYHLENNAGAKAALMRQLGASGPHDLLREGDEVSFRLTASRGPGG